MHREASMLALCVGFRDRQLCELTVVCRRIMAQESCTEQRQTWNERHSAERGCTEDGVGNKDVNNANFCAHANERDRTWSDESCEIIDVSAVTGQFSSRRTMVNAYFFAGIIIGFCNACMCDCVCVCAEYTAKKARRKSLRSYSYMFQCVVYHFTCAHQLITC